MILGVGCDITNINRVLKSAKFADHFMRRICGQDEINEIKKLALHTDKEKACLLAKYFAGKEAFVKALGTGFRDGIFMKDIQILHNPLGKPYFKITGQAAQKLADLSTQAQTHISLSDDFPYAQAFAVIEG